MVNIEMSNYSIPEDNPAFSFTVDLISALSQSGKGLQDLLDIGYKILNNPIMIADKSWKAIAMTPNVEIPDDNSWNEFLNNGFLSPDTIASSIQDQLVSKIDTSKTPFKWLSADMKYPRIFSKIILNSSTPAIISVLEYNRAFSESDYELVKILSDAVATEFRKNEYQQFTRGNQHEDLFVNILEGRLNDPGSVTERLKVLKLKLKCFLYVFTFDVFDSMTNQISVTYLRDIVEEMITDGKALIYNGRVILLANFTTEDSIHKAITDLEVFLEKFDIRCGISRCFKQLADLRIYYEQAINALSAGHHMDPERFTYLYSDYAMYHVSQMYWDSGWAKSFIHPALKALIMFDKEYGTDFIFSLNTYLRNFGNITNMSKAMNLHRNTSVYRIQRIEEIMNISLSDYNTMEQIIFSLRLMEYDKTVKHSHIFSNNRCEMSAPFDGTQ